MVMTSGETKQKDKRKTARLAGRHGHRVARLSDSMLVVGGVDAEGVSVNQMHRINGQSTRLDSLILDTGLSLEGFSLFCLQENLYVWGGCTDSEQSNQLLQFEGSKFLTLRQQGSVPSARTDQLSVSFGSKYLIVFGGHDDHQFFSDWHLLNITNFEWTRLTPCLELPPCSGGQMAWLSGRGLLLLNDFFDQTLNVYFPNRLFQFYVSDFNKGCLKVVPLPLPALSVFTSVTFTSMLSYDRDSVLLLGGYRYNQLKDVHNLCFRLFPQDNRCQQLFLQLPKALGFQPILYRSQLFLFGGQAVGEDAHDGFFTCSLQPPEAVSGYKRHVCEMCGLYFDEEWKQSTKQIYQDSTVRDDYDYNYRMRVDNRVLEKFASYIRQDFYAFTMILATLRDMGAQEIETSLQKIKDLSVQPSEQSYQYLKIGCVINDNLLKGIVNQIMMDQVLESPSMVDQSLSLNQLALRLKLGSFRLGRSTLIVVRLSLHEVLVIYYSSSQLECTSTNFSPFSSYSYVYNSKTRTCDCPILRGLVHENIKPIFPHPQDYEQLNQNNLSLTFFCGEELEAELTITESPAELETGESSIMASHKEENKRTIPLIQLAFLPNQTLPTIEIEHNQLKFYHLEELLEGDSKNGVLDPVPLQGITVNSQVIHKIVLFVYPEEYWLKRIMVYHRGRLISHFKEPENRLCGIIELHPEVPLDLGATNLAKLEDKRTVENLLYELRSLKRAPTD